MKKLAFLFGFLIMSILSLALVNPNYESPIVNVVKAAAPAVVNIEAKVKTYVSLNPYMDEFFKKFFGEIPWGYEREARSLGSGFIFDKRGYIMTNYHVVENADEIWVSLLNGKKYEAKYIGGDKELDLAILKIKAKEDLPTLELGDSDKIEIGEWAIAIGNPLGFKHTVTLGVVSALHRKIPKPDGSGYYIDLIQTDAAINPGNSGGPLLNIHAQVIGINTAIVNPMQGVNLGFAIPINMAKRFAEEIIKVGRVRKAYLGVYIQDVTEELQKALGLKTDKGAYVTDVTKGSPAYKAGIKDGDVIIGVDNRKVENADELVAIIRSHVPGDEVTLTIIRDGNEIKIKVTLGTLEEKEQPIKEKYLGIVVRNVTPEDLSELKLPKDVKGVIVDEVQENSRAQMYGIKVKDVIVEVAVNGKRHKIENVNDWNKVMKELSRGDYVALIIFRKGFRVTITFMYR